MFNDIKRSLFFKSISLFLVLSFSFYNVSFASIEKDDRARADLPLMVEDIGIAIDSGTIKSRHQTGGDKVIIHIQDAHCNYEAQQNINRILEQLSAECGVNMISVEGAEGIVDTSWFRAFPDAEIRKEVATYFMKKGELTGAEFFSIISDNYGGTIFGAESREAYIKNLKAFTATYPYKPMMENFFLDTRTIANRLKAIIYSKKLKALDLKIRAFDSKDIKLGAFAAYLDKCIRENRISLTDYPDFKKLVDTLEYEGKIDFDIVDQERGQYIDFLSKKLSKEEMTELVTHSIKFKKGHIKAVEFYTYLRDIARKQTIPMLQKYPNLFYYYIYTKLYDGIDNEKLFKEIREIEISLKNKLFEDDTERALDKYAEMLDMYVNLVNIELTNDDYELFEKYMSEFSVHDIVEFLSGLCAGYNLNYVIDTVPAQISENIPNMVDFYEIAMKRDKALVDNTLAQMEKGKENVSVLIAGGFHTRGMKDLLAKRGVSYVVVMPKITKDVETPYIKVLTNQRTSLADIITESAMPVPAAAVSKKEGVGTARPELLSPLLRFASGVSWWVDPEKHGKLIEWSDEMGAIAGGETFAEAAQQAFNDTVDMCTERWLDAIKKRMTDKFGEEYAEKEWSKFVNDDIRWGLLLSVYLGTYRDAGVKVDTYPIVAKAIESRFAKYRNRRAKGTAGRDGTPGEHPALAAARTNAQALAADEIIGESIRGGRALPVSREYDYIRPGFRFVVHEGLADALRARAAGLDTGVHPGRGGYVSGASRGLLQAHIDKGIYGSLTEAERETVARHELAHLDIFNGDNGVTLRGEALATWREWRAWVAADPDITADNIADKQEDFVNALPGCDVRSIEKSLANIERDRVLSARFKDMRQLGEVPADKKICLLFAGGVGTRLIGVSTPEAPKQIVPIFRDPKTGEQKSSLQIGIERALEAGFLPENIRIQTTGALLRPIQDILVGMSVKGLTADNAYAEPAYADTAAAFGYGFACLVREGRGDNAVFVGTADHIIDLDSGEFKETVNNALDVVYGNPLIATIGIVPLEANNDFGHLEVGPETSIPGMFALAGFEEKPEGEKAQELFDRGDLFNSGMFLATPETVMEEFKKVAEKKGLNPDVDDCYYRGLSRIIDAAEGKKRDSVEREEFVKFARWKKDGKSPESPRGVSFDYVIAEQSEVMITTPGNFYWRDIGGYKAIYEQYAEPSGKYYAAGKTVDKKGNVVLASAEEEDIVRFNNCEKCLVIIMDNADGEGFRADISLSGLKSQLVVYNPSKRMTMVASLDMPGSVLKALQDKVLNVNPYTAQFLGRGIPEMVDKRGEVLNVDIGANVETRAARTGIIKGLGNRDVVAACNSGLLLLPGTKEARIDVFRRSNSKRITIDVSKIDEKNGIILDPFVRNVVPEDMRGTDNEAIQKRAEDITGILTRGEKEYITLEEFIEMYDATHSDFPNAEDQLDNVLRSGAPIYKTQMEINGKKRIVYKAYPANRRAYMEKHFPPAGFGTSGIRGADEKLVDFVISTTVVGVVEYLKNLPEERGGVREGLLQAAFAGDLRPSTPRIAIATAAAIRASGLEPVFGGEVPSQAIMNYGLMNNIISFMITGSHNPFGQNGEKANTTLCEVLKHEEKAILEKIEEARQKELSKSWKETMFTPDGMYKSVKEMSPEQLHDYEQAEKDARTINMQVKDAYVARYVDALGIDFLKGVESSFWMQSAVGREIIPRIWNSMGARMRGVRKAPDGTFIPVDTENLQPAARKELRDIATELNREVARMPDADEKLVTVNSTDGDSDRPVFCDETGEFIHGDKLGVMACVWLAKEGVIKSVAVPITSNHKALGILRDMGIKVVQTDVGSPYVIGTGYDATEDQTTRELLNAGCDVAFEVNGGFLVCKDLRLSNGNALSALPTRCGIISQIFATRLAKDMGLKISEMAEFFFGAGAKAEAARELGEKLKVNDVVVQNFIGGKYQAETMAGLVENLPESGNITPGCEMYETDMGKGVIKALTPKDPRIAEFRFIGDEIKVVKKKTVANLLEGDEIEEMASSETASELSGIREALVSYLGDISGLRNINITAINVMNGIRVYFANGEVVHLRPSGNAAQFRIYTLAKTTERGREMVEDGTRGNTGVLVRLIQDYADGKLRASVTAPGKAEAVTPGIYAASIGPAVRAARKKAAIEKLGEIIKAGQPVRFVPFLKTGDDGYTWGQPLPVSVILEIMGAEDLEEKQALAAEYGIPLKRRLASGEEVVDQEIAERLYSAGEIDVDGVRLPVETLELFREDVSGLTTKLLASAKVLSLQIHEFDEMIVAQEDGYIYLGLKKDVTPEEFVEILKAGSPGDIKRMLNRVKIAKGDVYIVPAGMVHAYGEVIVYEMKAVSPAGDKPGTISFFDRLKYLDDSEIWGLIQNIVKYAVGYKDAYQILVDKGFVREGKDVLTLPDEMDAIAIARKIQGYGFLRQVNPGDYRCNPVVLHQAGTGTCERLAQTEDFVLDRYTITEGESIEVSGEALENPHPLTVIEGRIMVKSAGGETEIGPEDDKMMPRNAAGYTMTAVGGPAVVYLSYKPQTTAGTYTIVRPFAKGAEVPGTDTPEKNPDREWAVNGEIRDDSRDGVAMSDILTINGNEIQPPAIIGPRAHRLVVQEGEVQIVFPDGTVTEDRYGEGSVLKMTAEGFSAVDQAGKYSEYKWELTGTTVEYSLRKSGANRAIVKVLYANDRKAETPVYTAYRMLAKHQDVLSNQKVGYIAPNILFAKDGPNSMDAEQAAINIALGSDDRGDKSAYNIRTYNGCIFKDDKLRLDPNINDILRAVDNLLSEERKVELALTEAQIRELLDKEGDHLEDVSYEDMSPYGKLWSRIKSGDVSIQPIADFKEKDLYVDGDIAGGKRLGWFFMREAQVGAFMQSALKKADVEGATTFARDTRRLMEVFTGKPVTMQDLYLMLPFNEIPDGFTVIDPRTGKMVPVNLVLWANNLLEKLLLTMPMRPLMYLREQLEARRKVMYSV
ncbi:MAG: hypothetical protein KKE01_00955 [Candidatus Omnitrophica bacterium]|nr:hypothetical protein [Candidatus Omnitrophota bacterium]